MPYTCAYPNYVVLAVNYFPYTDDPEFEGYFYKEETRYNFLTKAIQVYSLGLMSGVMPSNEIFVDTGTPVDAYQIGTTVFSKYVIVTGSVLTLGTNTYNNCILLYVKITDGSPTDYFTFSFFNGSINEQQTSSSPTRVPCFSDFVLTTQTIKTMCLGYTQRAYNWDSEDEIVLYTDTPNSPGCGYTPPVEGEQVTEEIRIKVLSACKNPVMLTWKNPHGGWDYWLFSKTQELQISTSSDGRIETPYFVLALTQGNTRDLGKNQSNTMTVGAQNLTRDEKNGIEKILVSNLVYQLNKDGSIKRYVKVLPGNFISEPDTNQGTFSVEFTIELPETSTIK